jgi:AraC-like DNA-binding protein
MPMIPLTFVLALAMGYFLLVEMSQPAPRNRFACAFLSLVIFQLTMVGLRFGYGFERLGVIYPFTAALIGPLAYLSFRNPASNVGWRAWALAIHLLPLAVALLLAATEQDLIDLAQGLFTLIYAAALLRLGLRERDTFPWVDFNRRDYVRRALWCVLALMLVSAITDLVIAFDSWRSQGANIPAIVGWTSIVIVALFVPYLFWQKFSADRSPVATGAVTGPGDEAAEKELLGRLDRLLESTQLHLDPDLNLNRMARKLGVPARQVSTAINRQRSVSVSQLINSLRIEEACRLLKETELPITRVMLQSGFITKSNFNREFSRRFGTSPSAWRLEN